MVSLSHDVHLPAATRVYLGMLIFVLFLLFIAVSFVGVMIYRFIEMERKKKERQQ
jgi:Na+-transporting methylmalonyl-CoA/oxaloacetate decarboxylase gamma subunit